MERDGITRVYIGHSGIPPTAYEVYPNQALKLTEDGLEGIVTGEEAQAIHDRADVSCTNVEYPASQSRAPGAGIAAKKWAVRTAQNERFDIERTDIPRDKEYEQLAQTLERHLGTIGLTIIVH